MIPWEELDTAPIPGEPDHPMRLMRRGDEFSIKVGTVELMTSRQRGSEVALAELACAELGGSPRPTVLIGGLGMGFTLGAARAALPPGARIVVAELVPAVVRWARGPLAHLYGDSLDDPRVEIRTEDVHRTIQSGPGRFDAILLDVDNGPDGLTQRVNDRLYGLEGLKRARFALRPGGALAVWSGAPDRRFKARMGMAGFDTREHRVHAHGASGRRHVVWLGLRPAGGW